MIGLFTLDSENKKEDAPSGHPLLCVKHLLMSYGVQANL